MTCVMIGMRLAVDDAELALIRKRSPRPDVSYLALVSFVVGFL
jgi:hypothetical protein